MIKSILDNIIYVNIEAIQNNNYVVSCIKFKEEKCYEFYAEFNLNKGESLNRINHFKGKNIINSKNTKEDFQEFIENLPLVYHSNSVKNIIYMDDFLFRNNKLLSSMELAAILEPYKKEYNLNFLFKNIIINDFEEEGCYNNNIKLIMVVNALLLRLFHKEEKKRKNTLYEVLIKYYRLKNIWGWTEFLLKPIMINYDDYSYVFFGEKMDELPTLNDIYIDYNKYEELLRVEDIWNNGGDFGYKYRRDQERFSNKIRENYEKGERVFIEAPTGSGKTFAYVLVAAIGSYINKINKRWEDSSFVISTDTKELQNQLIDRDIPYILHKLKLLDKLSYGAMKGKNNYLCRERLNSADCFEGVEGRLARLFLSRLGETGEYGEVGTINMWAYKHFNIDEYWSEVCCDSEKCNLEKCNKACYLRKRYNEIPTENITVINHSLLASWPYGEKKKINHLILDESHNLMEKAYDFYTEEFNTKVFFELLYSIEQGHPSIYMLLNKLNGEHGYREQISLKNIKYWIDEISNNIYMLLGGFREMQLKNDGYNFSTEFNLAREEYKESIVSTRPHISNLKENIYSLYKLLSTYVANIILDDETNGDSDYKSIMEFVLSIKNAFDIIDKFLEESKYDAKIIEIDLDFREFTIKNVPLLVGELINENLLKGVKSTTFLSATLRVDNSFRMIKNHLGQNTAKELRIPQIFNLRDKTRIFAINSDEKYNSAGYVDKNSIFIFNMAKKIDGHMLVLFNNNKRREDFYNKLLEMTKNENIEVYKDKRSIKLLKDKSKRVIILGSKGFFEGIDVPGDGLSCVIIDKIPNKTPDDPLLKAITTYQNKRYHDVNYPQICIKMKQIYGRLIRSNVDYGYFIILDPGENNYTLKNLERDLGGGAFIRATREQILNKVEEDFNKWRNENLQFLKIQSNGDIEKFKNESKKYKLFWDVQNNLYKWK